MQFNLSGKGDFKVVTVVLDGELLTADNSNPNWSQIMRGLEDESLDANLFDLSTTVAKKFESLSERVSVSNGHIYFDGQLVNNDLTQQIVRFLEEEVDDWEPLVLFWENLANNINEHSRDQAYRWLADRRFTIDEDGFLLAYKGVEKNSNGDYLSVHSGPAIVNGVAVNGQVKNNPGSRITMARNEVQFDPGVGCSFGLHAGTWEYARSFASNVVLVRINPRDIVSVPTDCYDQKMRVCAYDVLYEVTEPIHSAIALSEKEDDSFSMDDEDVYCCDVDEDDDEQDYSNPYWTRY